MSRDKDLAARIRQIRGGLTQRNFSKIIDISSKVVSEWERGVSKPKIEEIRKISDKFNISGHWLLTGEGPKERPSTKEAAVEFGQMSAPIGEEARTARQEQEEDRELRDISLIEVPILRGTAGLGNPKEIEDKKEGTLTVPRSWISHIGHCYAVRVEGDSMLPLIPSGVVVVVDTAQRNPYALRGKIVAARLDDYVTIKRLIEQDGRFHIVADNPMPEFRSLELDFRGGNPVLGCVIGLAKKT
jgi:SOS-response transcriptional repressor LexA